MDSGNEEVDLKFSVSKKPKPRHWTENTKTSSSVRRALKQIFFFILFFRSSVFPLGISSLETLIEDYWLNCLSSFLFSSSLSRLTLLLFIFPTFKSVREDLKTTKGKKNSNPSDEIQKRRFEFFLFFTFSESTVSSFLKIALTFHLLRALLLPFIPSMIHLHNLLSYYPKL